MHPDARSIVEALGLVPHPEGGFYREAFRSTIRVGAAPRERAASTAIYFLLAEGTFSALHRVRSDEVWHHYDGGPLELHTIDAAGAHAVSILGRRLALGERPQRVVPAGVWQAALPVGQFALCGCTVAPGFEFADFEMRTREHLTGLFPGLRPLIERLTRS